MFFLLFFISISSAFSIEEKIHNEWIQNYMAVSENSSPPKHYRKWIRLARKHGCSTEPADYKQIFEDLKPFKNEILSIDKIYYEMRKCPSNCPFLEFWDKDELIDLSSSFNYKFGNSLTFVSKVLDPNIDFLTITNGYDESIVAPSDDQNISEYSYMKDVLQNNKQISRRIGKYSDKCMLLKFPTSFVTIPLKIPIFSVSRLSGYLDILSPTVRTGLPAYKDHLNTALNSTKWNKKKNSAIFRGRTTGIDFEKARKANVPLTNNPRFKLHEMTMKQKQGKLNCSVELDFGITDIWQYNDDKRNYLKILRQYPPSKHLSFEEQFKYKYLVVVDGNSWPDRVAFFLMSGSLVFLSTLHEEWVINQLVDGEHYIKVKPDLSDLLDKIEWASRNDKLAAKIAQNGKNLAMNKFGIKQMQLYNALLFMEYQRLFNRTQ